jgi:hypothetical protein
MKMAAASRRKRRDGFCREVPPRDRPTGADESFTIVSSFMADEKKFRPPGAGRGGRRERPASNLNVSLDFIKLKPIR